MLRWMGAAMSDRKPETERERIIAEHYEEVVAELAHSRETYANKLTTSRYKGLCALMGMAYPAHLERGDHVRIWTMADAIRQHFEQLQQNACEEMDKRIAELEAEAAEMGRQAEKWLAELQGAYDDVERERQELRDKLLEQQRGEPVGWVDMGELFEHCHPTITGAGLERLRALKRRRVSLYAAPPEPAEQPADDPATAEARKWLDKGYVPISKGLIGCFLAKLPSKLTCVKVEEPVYDAAVRLMKEREAAGHDPGDEDDGIRVVPAPETPLDDQPHCLPTCGTAHRGCDPQCPKRWYEQGCEETEAALIGKTNGDDTP